MSIKYHSDVSEIYKTIPQNHNLCLPNYDENPLKYTYQPSVTLYLAFLQSKLFLAAPYLPSQIPFQSLTSHNILVGKVGVMRINRQFSSSVQRGLGFFARTNGVEKVMISKRSALIFGVARLTESRLIFDDDLESGCRFTAAQSSLYLLMKGKSSLKWIIFDISLPVFVSGVTLGNTVIGEYI